MTVRQSSVGLALFALCGGLLAPAAERCLLGAPPVPAHTAQQVAPSSPEPPLADAPPALAPVPLVPGLAPGTLCPVDPPVPVVAVRVRVPACTVAGQELEYRICVENRSRAAAHHVLLRDPLPANARFVRASPEPTTHEPDLLWSLGTLEPCASREIALVLLPTGPGEVKNCARVQFEHGQCVCTRIAPAESAPVPPPEAPGRAEIKITKRGPSQAVLYDALAYQVVVTNMGAVPATGVMLTDTLPEGLEPIGGKNPLTWDVGALQPGQSRTVDYQVSAKKTGKWTNKAVVTAAGGVSQEASTTVEVGEAKLELIKTGPTQRFLNRPATYQITVSNPGNAPANHVTITDLLPERTEFVSASDSGQRKDNQVQWMIGSLAPGARRTVQVVLKGTVPGEIVNRATARADRDLKAEGQAMTVFEGATGLTVDVDDKDDPIEVGGETTYTITVQNQGMVAATKIVITALVPEQLEVKAAKGPAKYQLDGQRVVFESITLEPHKEAIYEVSVKARRAGDVRFKVELTADQLPGGPVRREESTTIYDPNIAPVKP
jgi:uncharacterized repeat protein (TIGR01451 family)